MFGAVGAVCMLLNSPLLLKSHGGAKIVSPNQVKVKGKRAQHKVLPKKMHSGILRPRKTTRQFQLFQGKQLK